MDNIIQIRGLQKSFGSHQVLKGIDLDVVRDRSLVIIGGSGTGKSVLIKNIIGLIKPDKGSITIDGDEIININRQKHFSILANCGFLFQGGALFDSLTVSDNITFFAQKLDNLSHSQIQDLAAEKLRDVGLEPRVMSLFPQELSGGMQKRVALARAICMNPKIIFFDEPTTGLDPIMANVINNLIVKVRDQLGATTITITHDINSAKFIGQDLAMMHEGKVIWHGDCGEIQNTKNAYLHQFVNGLIDGPIVV